MSLCLSTDDDPQPRGGLDTRSPALPARPPERRPHHPPPTPRTRSRSLSRTPFAATRSSPGRCPRPPPCRRRGAERAGAVFQLEQGEQDVLGADVVVAEPERLPERAARGPCGPRVVRASAAGSSSTAAGSAAARPARIGSSRDACARERTWRASPSGSVSRPSMRCAGATSALPAARASLWAATTTLRARAVNRPKPCAGRASRLALALGTNRFCAACLVTPMLRPMSVHDAPERRAWSTKCPIRWSATSPRCSAASTASDSCSRRRSWTFLMASIRSSSRIGGCWERFGHASTLG